MLCGSYIRAASREQTRAVFKRFLELKMGNFVSLNISRINVEEVFAVIDEMVGAGIYFVINGDITKLTPADCKTIEHKAGKYYIGISAVTELGSLLYWDRDYFETLNPGDFKVMGGKKLFGANDLVDAHDRYMSICRQIVEEQVIRHTGDTANLVVEASLVQNHLMEIGCAFPCVELICGNPELMIACARGSARACGAEMWMGYIPECYLGFENDTLRAKRFFLTYAASYISGAGIILRESGPWYDRGRVYEKPEAVCIFAGYDDFDTYFNEDYHLYREISIAFHNFADSDNRPSEGPRVALGIVKGELDGFAGMWDRRVWGQVNGTEWEHGDIEREWDYFWQLYRRREWSDSYHYGKEDLSGNPPCGQVDIVPAESPLCVWQKYKTLVFLGWNTMTDILYETMLAYVRSGGNLVVSTSHLRANIKRGEPMKLFRDGDFADLFGIKIAGPADKRSQGVRFIQELSWCHGLPVWQTYSPGNYSYDPVCIDGAIQLADCKNCDARVIACATTGFCPDPNYPIIVEKKLEQGSAALVCTWSTPGQLSMQAMMKTLIRTLSCGATKDVKFSGCDRFRYAVYGTSNNYKIYILNTDFDNVQGCKLTINEISVELMVNPCSIEVLAFDKGIFSRLNELEYSQLAQWIDKRNGGIR